MGEAAAFRTTINRLSWLLATENRRSAVLITLWGLAITAAYAQALFQRAYMTLFDYGVIVVICVVAGAIIMDVGRALLSYIAAMALGITLLFVLVSVPASSSIIPPPGDIIFTYLWVTILFTAVFPFPFIGYLIATIVGATIGERYL